MTLKRTYPINEKSRKAQSDLAFNLTVRYSAVIMILWDRANTQITLASVIKNFQFSTSTIMRTRGSVKNFVLESSDQNHVKNEQNTCAKHTHKVK